MEDGDWSFDIAQIGLSRELRPKFGIGLGRTVKLQYLFAFSLGPRAPGNGNLAGYLSSHPSSQRPAVKIIPGVHAHRGIKNTGVEQVRPGDQDIEGDPAAAGVSDQPDLILFQIRQTAPLDRQ